MIMKFASCFGVFSFGLLTFAPPAASQSTLGGKFWAVVIGINEYQYAPRLGYAVNDAEEMAKMLNQMGFLTIPLTTPQSTTRLNIETELGTNLVERVKLQDRVLIFFSGHGEDKQVPGGKRMGYLLPVDAKPQNLAGTAISMGRIQELAEALPAKQVLFLVDVCYGGIAGFRLKSVPAQTEAYVRQITRERGRQLITAGGAGQQVIEVPSLEHSVFTHFLLKGLGEGVADLNQDGVIPASELYAYLDKRVYDEVFLQGHEQRPEMWRLSSEPGEFVFRVGMEFKGPSLPAQRPTAPTIQQARAFSASQVMVSWTAATDEVGVTAYTLYRNGTAVGTTPTLSYVDTGLAAATTYAYTVTALDAAGNESTPSATTSVTTPGSSDTTPPAAPKNLRFQ